MSEKESTRITRAAGVVSGATLVSRILGFVRDMVVAYFFGSGMTADAFFVAFRLPNLLRRLFAEGALSVAFIPVFTEYLRKHSQDEALRMAQTVFMALSLTLLAVTLLGEILAPALVWVIAPGFAEDPEKYRITIQLTRITFPYIFFIGLVALCQGVLNSLRHFAAPALSPALLNVFMICGVYFWSLAFADPIYGLAIGALAGGAAQLAMQAPFMKKRGFSFRPRFDFSHPALKRILLLMGPAALGSAIYQFNIVVGTLLASLLPQGSVSYLYYADRIVEFPLGVFAIALGTAVLPSMSRHTADNDIPGLISAFSHAMRLVIFIMVPASVGLIVLRHPIVELIYQRGEFTSLSTRMTAEALLYYTLGLWAFSSTRILTSAYYAMQDTKTPVKVACIAFPANILFSLVLMGPLKHGGLALATSLASALNVVVLLLILKRRLHRLDGRAILESFMKTMFASLVMAAALYALLSFPVPGGRLVNLILLLAAGVAVFGLASLALKSAELKELLSTYRPQKGQSGKDAPS